MGLALHPLHNDRRFKRGYKNVIGKGIELNDQVGLHTTAHSHCVPRGGCLKASSGVRLQ